MTDQTVFGDNKAAYMYISILFLFGKFYSTVTLQSHLLFIMHIAMLNIYNKVEY